MKTVGSTALNPFDSLIPDIRTDLIITGIYLCNTTVRCQLSAFTFIWSVASRFLSSRHLSIDLDFSINPRMVAFFSFFSPLFNHTRTCTKFPSLRYRVGLGSKPIVIRVTNLPHDGVNPNHVSYSCVNEQSDTIESDMKRH